MSTVIVGPYRLRLDRVVQGSWGTHPVACILGVNPSTADHELNDHTVTKLINFGSINRWSRIIVGNKFAYRATDVKQLKTATDPVGPLNDEFLHAMMLEADVLIAAWGPLAKLPCELRGRWREVVKLTNKPFLCFGTAKDGQPIHPLMVPYARELTPWTPPA